MNWSKAPSEPGHYWIRRMWPNGTEDTVILYLNGEMKWHDASYYDYDDEGIWRPWSEYPCQLLWQGPLKVPNA